MTAPAPYLAALAEGPAGAHAIWVTADDGVRLRVALCPQGQAGTVLILPGRTEYIEKYGRVAQRLRDAGYASAIIDWRGQGLSDRLTADRRTGHVARFSDYLRDLQALFEAARGAGLPQPWHLLAHSMGGTIGLAALYRSPPVASAVFSAPMWEIALAPTTRLAALGIGWIAGHVERGHVFAPGTEPETYVLTGSFEENSLTHDRGSWDYMRRQVSAWPDLALGGPSLQWLYEAITETDRLRALDPPAVPALSFYGSEESIVCNRAIEARMAGWPSGQLTCIEGSRHEVLMELHAMREQVLGTLLSHLRTHG